MSDPLIAPPYTPQHVADAEKFLRLLLVECGTGPSEHEWRRCRRCLAFDQLQGHQPLARRLVQIAADVLADHARLAQEVARQFDLLLPPRPAPTDPPADTGLVSYGVTWRGGKYEPLLTPMPDGYWTPWHIAAHAVYELRQRAEQSEAEVARLQQALAAKEGQ